MNKEQILFLCSLLLLGGAGAVAAMGWKTETAFKPPAESRTKQPVLKRELTVPQFAPEAPETAFVPGGRDPFGRKTDTKPLPLAELPAPPLPPKVRVAPGPFPMPGFSNLRPLEEPIPQVAIDLQTPAGAGDGEEGEGEDDGGWDGRRW